MSADERREARDAAGLLLRAAQLSAHGLAQKDHGSDALNAVFAEVDTHREAAEVFAAALGLQWRLLPPSAARDLATAIRGLIPGLMLRVEGHDR